MEKWLKIQPEDNQKLTDGNQKQLTEVKMAEQQKNNRITVCIVLIQQIWSHFKKTYNELINQPNVMNIFFEKSYVLYLLHHRKMRAVEIIGTRDCHDIHVPYKWMYTFDLNCLHFH